jgi:hypothetical protein
MANILDGMEGGKHNSDNIEVTTPTFEVVLRFTDIDAKNPLEATKKILNWLSEADAMIYEVENEITHEKWMVDLSEDAVLPNNE